MIVTDYARTFLGRPYLWGGSSPLEGFDCSGLCLELLKSVGLAPPTDVNAQGLYQYLRATGSVSGVSEGAFAFYGKSSSQISHVAYMINNNQIIEAGGGTSKTITLQDAIEDNAFIRVRNYMHRKDLVEILKPFYPKWVTGG